MVGVLASQNASMPGDVAWLQALDCLLQSTEALDHIPPVISKMISQAPPESKEKLQEHTARCLLDKLVANPSHFSARSCISVCCALHSEIQKQNIKVTSIFEHVFRICVECLALDPSDKIYEVHDHANTLVVHASQLVTDLYDEEVISTNHVYEYLDRLTKSSVALEIRLAGFCTLFETHSSALSASRSKQKTDFVFQWVNDVTSRHSVTDSLRNRVQAITSRRSFSRAQVENQEQAGTSAKYTHNSLQSPPSSPLTDSLARPAGHQRAQSYPDIVSRSPTLGRVAGDIPQRALSLPQANNSLDANSPSVHNGHLHSPRIAERRELRLFLAQGDSSTDPSVRVTADVLSNDVLASFLSSKDPDLDPVVRLADTLSVDGRNQDYSSQFLNNARIPDSPQLPNLGRNELEEQSEEDEPVGSPMSSMNVGCPPPDWSPTRSTSTEASRSSGGSWRKRLSTLSLSSSSSRSVQMGEPVAADVRSLNDGRKARKAALSGEVKLNGKPKKRSQL